MSGKLLASSEDELQARMARIRELDSSKRLWKRAAKDYEARIEKAKAILRNTVEKKYEHFILDIDDALAALEGK